MSIPILKTKMSGKIKKSRIIAKNDVSRIVCLDVYQVANVFWLWEIYSFVAFEKLYRIGKTRKNVHSNFKDKNVGKDESVFKVPEPNYDILWMTQSLWNSILTHWI